MWKFTWRTLSEASPMERLPGRGRERSTPLPRYPHLRGLDKQEVRSLLDAVAREGAQRMLIDALEQEVDEFFGRARYVVLYGERYLGRHEKRRKHMQDLLASFRG